MPQNLASTADFILEKTAPIFNKQGYVGTSLSHLTKATGLTKGAIYCNFTNKEDLALKAFKLNVSKAILPLFKLINEQENSLEKLYAITTYQRSYYDLIQKRGGCPMVRVGVDAKFINPALFNTAKKISEKYLVGLIDIINEGIDNDEFNKSIDAYEHATLILSMIEGSTLLASTHNDEKFITNTMDFIDTVIIEKMKK